MRVQQKKPLISQQGFVLATVLVILLILSLIVAALLSNQTSAIRTLRDILAHSKKEQDSHNIHRTCLKYVHDQLTEDSLSQASNINLTKLISLSDGSCQVFIEIDAITSKNQNSWTPRLRIISKSNTTTRSEITDWRYPKCIDSSNTDHCFTAPNANLTLTNEQNTHNVIVQYLRNTPIQVAWRQQ